MRAGWVTGSHLIQFKRFFALLQLDALDIITLTNTGSNCTSSGAVEECVTKIRLRIRLTCVGLEMANKLDLTIIVVHGCLNKRVVFK